MEGRDDGLVIAWRIVNEEGIEGLEKEIRFRNATGFNTSKTNKELDKLTEPLKQATFHTFKIATIAILHDEFGFGEKRVRKFNEGFDKLMEYLGHGWAYWTDFIGEISERLKIEVEIPDGDERYPGIYRRPKNEDIWEETDLIEQEEWKTVLAQLGYTEKKNSVDGKSCIDVYDEQGNPLWRYDNKYDQIALYDFFTGIMFAKRHYGIEEEQARTIDRCEAGREKTTGTLREKTTGASSENTAGAVSEKSVKAFPDNKQAAGVNKRKRKRRRR